jgi:hypothetical protein
MKLLVAALGFAVGYAIGNAIAEERADAETVRRMT